VAPTDIALSAGSIAENSANATVVGALSRTDANSALGDTATFTLLNSAGGRFAISGANLVVANGKLLDFESGASHQVTVRVTDAKGLAYDEVVTVNVANVSPETIVGTAAANILAGGSDKDRLFGLGGNDKLFGNGSSDTLAGGAGNDILTAGSGFDTLIGGFGRDLMTGGAHRDIFDFNALVDTGKTLFTRDVIKDFSHFQGDDIDLSTIDAMTGVGNQKFAFIGQSDFTSVKGQLHFKFLGPAKTIVEGDVNGDKKADFQIELTGHKLLVAGDFIL
jgi:Ca2+-binding RTX toxin-like protein